MASMWRFLLFICALLKLTAQGKKDVKPKNPYFTKFQETAHLRPTKCQVCRLLVTEFIEKMKSTNSKKSIPKSYSLDLSEDQHGSIDYQKSEIRLMEVLDGLCDRMKLYQARAGPEFPYIKGAVGHLREVFNDISAKSKVKLKFELPDDIVDDYTHEITRVKFECIHLLERVEEQLEDWYFNHQDQDLMAWLCADKILEHNQTECLTASSDLPTDYHDAFNEEQSKPSILDDNIGEL